MTIYQALNIDENEMRNPIRIQTNLILANISSDAVRADAAHLFQVIETVEVKTSVGAGANDMELIEITLTQPTNINRIAEIIQQTIPHQIIFVFRYEEKSLILIRNFTVNPRTENVTTNTTSFCTNWIYDEYLVGDLLGDTMYGRLSRTLTANSSLQDFISNITVLDRCISDYNAVSCRFILDWLKSHAIGGRIDFRGLIGDIAEHGANLMIATHQFFDKHFIETRLNEDGLPYFQTIGNTGRSPAEYFETIQTPATFDDEAEVISLLLRY